MTPYELLLDALFDPDRVVGADAARLLGGLGRREAAPALVRYVTECRYHAKVAAFEALARIGDASVCPAIRPRVDDPHVYDDWYWYGAKTVRAAAATALLALGDDSGAAYLTELADKHDDALYAWMAPAVLALGDTTPATAAIKARLSVQSLTGANERSVRLSDPGRLTRVVEALGLIGGDEAARAIAGWLGFRSRYVRAQAAVSLLAASSSQENIEAVAALRDRDGTDFVRIRATQALIGAGAADDASPLLDGAVHGTDAVDRGAALEALGLLGRADGIETALAALDDGSPYVRLCAIEALDRLDAGGDAVARRMEDPSPRVRLQAAAYLAARDGEVNR
ncbi:MAG: hypothetical protein GX591_13050 [Planctomycetes bacterium]|nr:hypothetical protein [Planctomycetota bacterium]